MKPITDIAIVPRQPRWPVRLDPVAPPSLRKVARNPSPSTTEPTMEPITDMEQGRSMAYHAAVRPLTDDEYALLKEDIAKRGIISPIIKDAAGNIVDGYHRNKIAEELGLTDIPIKKVDGTEPELQAMAIALNVARRQLDVEDRRELVAQLRAEGKSTRQIAEQLGVDQSTVVRDLAKASDATASVDRVTGKDGKSRPARMPAKAKAKKAAPATKAEPKAPTEAPQAPEPAKVTPTAPEVTPATEAVATPGDVLLDTFHKLTPAEQVTTMQLFWDVLADWQKQQLREHVTAELPMSKLLVERWSHMSGGEKAGVHSFLAAEMAKFATVNRPAAPAAQNGAATGIT
jgi:ParB-like chromosome segregation protein Spo0J